MTHRQIGLWIGVALMIAFGLGAWAENHRWERYHAPFLIEASRYENYKYMEKLGMVRWELACARAAPANMDIHQIEKQCTIHIDDIQAVS